MIPSSGRSFFSWIVGARKQLTHLSAVISNFNINALLFDALLMKIFNSSLSRLSGHRALHGAVALVFALFLLAGCGPDGLIKHGMAESDAERDAALRKQIDFVLQVRGAAAREVIRLRNTEPAVAALLEARSLGASIDSATPVASSGYVVVNTAGDFNWLCREARAAVAFATGKMPVNTKILIERNVVRVSAVEVSANAEGTPVERKTEFAYPLSWVQTFAPKILP
jgi:hypothetical protein